MPLICFYELSRAFDILSLSYFFDKTVCKIYYASVVFHKVILLSIIIGYELSEIL